MSEDEFVVTRFENRNGVTSWRVAGWLHGVRIRKNFKSREDAAAEKAALEMRAARITSSRQHVATSLSEQQVREAEALFQRVADKPRPLSFYVDFALTHHREPEQEKKLAEAIAEYTASKRHEHEQDLLSISQLNRIIRDLKRVNLLFPRARVSELTGPRLVTFFEMGPASLKTFNNRRGIVSTFMKYAFQKGWIAENPLLRVPAQRIRRRRSSAKTLTADQAREMMHALENFEGGRWVPYFALALFAGIRPTVPHGEIARLRPDAIDLEKEIISISAEVSKIREPRKIVIQANLAAWLRAYPLSKFPVVVGDFQRRRAELSKRFGLSHDVMRHTFISMFVAKFRSLGEAALQAGNSESIIRRHYLELKTTAEAEQFFGIMPARSGPAAEPLPFPAIVPPPLAAAS